MPLWGKTDVSSNAVKFAVLDNKTANGAAMYINTTANAFRSGEKVGVFGVSLAEARSGAYAGKIASPGWVLARWGTGPVTGFTNSTSGTTLGGTSYTNGNIVTVSGGATNATATVTTNSTGGVTALTLTANGTGFSNVSSSTTAVANSLGGATGVGTGASIQPTFGGRAGRVSVETLVASKNLSSDGDSSVF